MDEYILDARFPSRTNHGQPNFHWAVREYFIEICNAHGVNNENRRSYIRDYNNNICDFVKPNLPITEYDDDAIKELVDAILAHGIISEVTMETRINHLILDPISWYCKKHGIDDPTWGSAYRFNDHNLGKEVALKRVQRSFTKKEALQLATILLTNTPELPGELFALIACLYFGSRNNEAAGLSFRDFHPMFMYPEEYYLQLGAITTNYGKNTLKTGGKTYNSPRLVPAMYIVAKAIIARIEYLESILTFPIEDENGTFN